MAMVPWRPPPQPQMPMVSHHGQGQLIEHPQQQMSSWLGGLNPMGIAQSFSNMMPSWTHDKPWQQSGPLAAFGATPYGMYTSAAQSAIAANPFKRPRLGQGPQPGIPMIPRPGGKRPHEHIPGPPGLPPRKRPRPSIGRPVSRGSRFLRKYKRRRRRRRKKKHYYYS